MRAERLGELISTAQGGMLELKFEETDEPFETLLELNSRKPEVSALNLNLSEPGHRHLEIMLSKVALDFLISAGAVYWRM